MNASFGRQQLGFRKAALLFAQLGVILVERGTAMHLRARQLRTDPTRTNNDDNTLSLTCRITVLDTLYEMEDGSLINRKQICCVPQVKGRDYEDEDEDEYYDPEQLYEGDDVFPMDDVPYHVLDQYQDSIHQGQLLALLKGVTIEDGRVKRFKNNSNGGRVEVSVIDDEWLIPRRRARTRRLQQSATKKAYDDATGTRTLQVIRVSTLDSEPSFTAQEMEDRIFRQEVGLASQYRACSFGQLEWQPPSPTMPQQTNSEANGAVLDIIVGNNISAYDSGSALRAAAEEKLKELDIVQNSASELADNVMFCLAPGTKGGWVANAGTKYWRSQYNDKWCLSLTASMHEVAHNLGLGHAHHNGKPYADETGYMAAAWMDVDWPRKCFNGANHDQFGWFESRTMAFDPTDGPRKVNLAPFVDYDKTHLGKESVEPVLIRLSDEYVLQYNVAKDFNKDTEEMKDMVTIVAKTSVGTDLRAGLKEIGDQYTITNYTNSTDNVVIEICAKQSNDDVMQAAGELGAADIMVVGIGPNACNLKVYGGKKNHHGDMDQPKQSMEKPPQPSKPADDSSSDDPSIEDDTMRLNAVQRLLLAWKTVAVRTTWFSLPMSQLRYQRQRCCHLPQCRANY